ncbi:MAG: phosphatase PAP2 family protein [Anaerolineae bacterium]|nr:phosphatase PAP2 family protein [Anaerolineae bacterium]
MKNVVRRLSDWERKATRPIALPEISGWRRAASLGAHLGDGALWAAIGLGLLIWGRPHLRALTVFIALAVLGTTIVSSAIKYTVRRPRPRELAQFYALKYDRYAFPSGHAMRMGVIATTVSHFEPRLAPAAFALALIVGSCRVLVGVHYPSDVVGGWAIGIAGGACFLLLL